MHLNKVTHILGLLLIFLSVFMLLPVPFSLFYGESDAPAFLISAALSLFAGSSPIKRPASTASCGRKKASPVFFGQFATPSLPASGGSWYA